jgi:hypothetical protein
VPLRSWSYFTAALLLLQILTCSSNCQSVSTCGSSESMTRMAGMCVCVCVCVCVCTYICTRDSSESMTQMTLSFFHFIKTIAPAPFLSFFFFQYDTRICVCMYVCIHTYILYMYVCMCVCMCVCMYEYILYVSYIHLGLQMATIDVSICTFVPVKQVN